MEVIRLAVQQYKLDMYVFEKTGIKTDFLKRVEEYQSGS